MAGLIIAAITAAVSAFVSIRKEEKKKKRSLTWWGIGLMVLMGIAVVVSSVSMLSGQMKEFEAQEANNNLQSKVHNLNDKLDSATTILSRKLDQAKAADSVKTAELRRIGYRFENGMPIPPQKNIQHINQGGRGIQNNASNYGIQNQGDLHVNAESRLNDANKLEFLKVIEDLEKKGGKCCVIQLVNGSNASAFFQDIIDFLNQQGYKIGPDRIVPYAVWSGPIPNKVVYFIDTDGTIKLSVGKF